jgi:hypothetical protein
VKRASNLAKRTFLLVELNDSLEELLAKIYMFALGDYYQTRKPSDS